MSLLTHSGQIRAALQRNATSLPMDNVPGQSKPLHAHLISNPSIQWSASNSAEIWLDSYLTFIIPLQVFVAALRAQHLLRTSLQIQM